LYYIEWGNQLKKALVNENNESDNIKKPK
jgi:hypothetical protein